MSFPESHLDRLRQLRFDIDSRHHADALLEGTFQKQLEELVDILVGFEISVDELVRGGGGRATPTQRLGNAIKSAGWEEHEFFLTKTVKLMRRRDVVLEKQTKSETHKIDHVRSIGTEILALEIEWNNKDPFFNRDLETFSRLHADGAISLGVIITRGRTLQENLLGIFERFANRKNLTSSEQLNDYDYNPTPRQIRDMQDGENRGLTFGEAWARVFTRDKFGAATTHWNKLIMRLEQGVGSPCPVLAIGLPSQIIKE